MTAKTPKDLVEKERGLDCLGWWWSLRGRGESENLEERDLEGARKEAVAEEEKESEADGEERSREMEREAAIVICYSNITVMKSAEKMEKEYFWVVKERD